MACVGQYGSQRVIARHNLTLSVYGRVFCRVLLMELLRSLFCGKGGDMKGAHGAWGKQLAVHLVGDDAHVEAEVDLDAGMEFDF